MKYMIVDMNSEPMQTVEGKQIGKYFAVRREYSCFIVDHLPTGNRCAAFETEEDAVNFAKWLDTWKTDWSIEDVAQYRGKHMKRIKARFKEFNGWI